MNSPIRVMTTPSHSLPAQLEQIGLHAVASGVDDFLARAADSGGRRTVIPG